jgi:hypothetical protein
MQWLSGNVLRGTFLVVIILAPRVTLFLTTTFPSAPVGELECSAACLARKGYLGDPYDLRPTGPSAHVAPAYPTILAGIYSQLGTGEQAHRVQAMLSMLLFTVGVCLLVPLGRSLTGMPWVGWLAAFAMAGFPLHLHQIQVLGQWEQTLTLLAVHVLLLVMLMLHRQQWQYPRAALGLGILGGGALLLSPQFGLVLALFGLVQLLVQPDRARVFRRLLVSAFLASLVILPWTIRNHDYFGNWIFIRGNLGLELALGNHDTANGFAPITAEHQEEMARRHPFLSVPLAEQYQLLGEREFMARQQRQAVAWIQQNPGRFLELCLIRARLFWFPAPWLWSTAKAGSFTPELRAAFAAVMTSLAILGLLLLALRNAQHAVLLGCVFLGMSASYYVTHVEPRYAFPVQGLLVLLGCYALVRVGQMLLPKSGTSS